MTWDNEARNILKSEITRRGMTYDRLVKRLNDLGLDETPRGFASKMSRGTFSFKFFLQCMCALGVEKVTIDVPQPGSHRGQKDTK